jgi:TrmH family RNA methyltransferase
LFFIEGLRIVGEAVQMGAPIEMLVYAPELLTSRFGLDLVTAQQDSGVPVLEVSADLFRDFSVKEGPQGLGALLRQRWLGLDAVQVEPGRLWTALDSVQDPGNLGTILRTHDAVGGAGLILMDHSTDPYDATALRASMGAVFSQQLVRTSFSDFARWKRAGNFPLIGASGSAPQDYHTFAYPDPMVLLMGSERLGLLDEHLRLCDGVVAIPMAGRSDSLNLSVATGIVLYEIFNQRRHSRAARN